MIAPRRFLPSISALLSFEAVVRLGTATAAAQELNLTQSAVSRQNCIANNVNEQTRPVINVPF